MSTAGTAEEEVKVGDEGSSGGTKDGREARLSSKEDGVISGAESAGSEYSSQRGAALDPLLRNEKDRLEAFYRAIAPSKIEAGGARFITNQLLNNFISKYKTTSAMNVALLKKYGVDLTNFDVPKAATTSKTIRSRK